MSTKTETAIVEIVLKGQQASASLKDIEKAARALRAQLGRLPADSQEFADKTQEFQKINSRLKSIKDDVNGVGGVFGKIGNEIKGFGILAAGYLGFDWLKGSISGIIKSNAELSDSLADIRKTTGMTDTEARKLNTSLSQINTRTAAKELRNIAIVGGQLGIAKGDIFAFTVAVDKMNVALGDEFTGGAEEVTKAMGGLRNTFTDIKSDKVDEDLLHIGNAINALASSGAATGPVISDFANRIGGVGITLGLTSDQVLGLSATLQELQVNQERGGTAVSKILQKMTTNTAEFAKVAGVPIQEFTNMVNKDLYGAFLKVVEGSKKGGVSATSFGKILNDLGVDGAGASEVFAKLSNNTALLNEKVALANTSLKGTDSIMAEFNIKNSTLASEMERLSKGFNSAFTNSTVSNGLKSMISLVADLFDKTKKVSESMVDEQNHVNALMIEIKSSNTTNERRKEIYDELKAINPSIIEGIDRESISMQALTENVNEYNQAQINRIAVQKKQEQVDEANKEAADKLIFQSEKATQAFEILGKIQQLNTVSSLKYKKIIDDENLSTTEKINKIYELARATEWYRKKNGEVGRDMEANFVMSWAGKASELAGAEKQYSDALGVSNKLTEEKNKLSKELLPAKKNEIDYTKLSTDELNRYIKNASDSLGNYQREEGKKSLEELKRREEAKKNTVILLDDAALKKIEENNKKRAEALKKHHDDLFKLEEDFNNRHQSTDDKAKQAIYDKYKVFLAAEKEGSEAYKNLIFKRDIEIAEFEKKQQEKFLEGKTDLINKIRHLNQTEQQNDIEDTNKKFDDLLVLAQQYGVDTTQLEEARQLALEAIHKKYADSEIKLNEAKNKKIADDSRNTANIMLNGISQLYGNMSNLISVFMNGSKVRSERELEKEKLDNTTKKDSFKRLLDNKLITKTEYDKRLNKIDNDQAKRETELKKKAAEQEKLAAIINITIQGILGIAKAAAAAPPPANIPLIEMAVIQGAVNLAAVLATPTAYAKGGFNNSDDPQGMVDKPTYFTNSSSGKDFIAGEKGSEWIAPNWMLQNPATANTIGMLEAIRQRGYASGGFNTSIPKNDSNTSTSKNNVNTSFVSNNTALVDAINNLNSILQNGINANINYDQFNKDISSIDSARSSAQVKN